MSEKISEVLIIVLVGTFLMLILVIFIITFFFIHQRKQQTFLLEKANLRAQFDQEILNAENEIQESTMKHISQELHDNVGQMLTLVKIQLNNLAEDIPENKKIIDSRALINNIISDVRSISKSINSDNFLHEGIVKAIGFELERVEKLGNYNVTFSTFYENKALDQKREVLVFRIFQELLQNCLKHAKAKNINVNLAENNQAIHLEMKDDGIGFDFEHSLLQSGFNSGAGLKNLQHRAHLMNGTMVFEKINSKGTKALLTIPI